MITITKDMFSALNGKTIDDAILDSIVSTANNFVTNSLPAELSAAKGKVKGEIYQIIDDKMKELGHPKPADVEFSTDWMKTVFSKLNTSHTETETKIAELEKKLKDGSGDASLKEKLSTLEQQKAALEEEKTKIKATHKEEFSKKEKEFNEMFIEAHLEASLPKIKKDSGFNDDQIKIFTKAAIDELKPFAKVVDKKVVFEKEGKLLLNPDNKQEPFRASELLSKAKLLENIIDTGTTAAGAGTGDLSKEKNKTLAGTVTIGNYKAAKNKAELNNLLQKDGYIIGSKEYVQVWNDPAMKALPEE